MQIPSDLEQILKNPSESLAVELKDWIDPDSAAGEAKIAKGCLALYNRNGGYLLIGFNDGDGSTEIYPHETPVENKFKAERIQEIISRYAARAFEISVYYPLVGTQNCVVISVPNGVVYPVACRRDLKAPEGQLLLKESNLYYRTLTSNGRPSTAPINWADWEDLLDVCFDNREADIGNFLRRHIGRAALSTLGDPEPSPKDALSTFFTEMSERAEATIRTQGTFPEHGYMEIAAKLPLPNDLRPNRSFLNTLNSANPRLTGWPMWVVLSGGAEERKQPYVRDGAWETVIADYSGTWYDAIDFWRFQPDGFTYHRRAYLDDVGGSERAPPPSTSIDFVIQIRKVAEAIAVLLAFANAFDAPKDENILMKAKWTSLNGRELSSWAHSGRTLMPGYKARSDSVETFISIPVDTSRSAIAMHVKAMVDPLLEAFDGFEISQHVVDDLVQGVLDRKV